MRCLAFTGTYRITQHWNDPCCRAHYQQWSLLGHNGCDFGTPTGTPLYAVEAGTIVEVMSDPKGYGLTVYLAADTRYDWRYGHLSVLSVVQGQKIAQGEEIGLSGNTGNSTGPHLHLGMRPPAFNRANGFSGYVDPLPRLQALTDAQGTGGAPATTLERLRIELDQAQKELKHAKEQWAKRDSDLGAVWGHTIPALEAQVADLQRQLAARPTGTPRRVVKVEPRGYVAIYDTGEREEMS